MVGVEVGIGVRVGFGLWFVRGDGPTLPHLHMIY